MKIVSVPGERIAYSILPYKRNQDIIKIIPDAKDSPLVVSLVDGWNWKEKIPGDSAGFRAATFVAKEYPQTFLSLKEKDLEKRAEVTSKLIDAKLLEKYPQHVSAVGLFLFDFGEKLTLVFIGKGTVLTWNGKAWQKPKKIGNYSLKEASSFPNDVSRFFGRGELKSDPFYSAKPDVVTISPQVPVFLATDGLDNVMTIEDLNIFSVGRMNGTPEQFIGDLVNEIERRDTQKDDISLLLRM